jgi:hypothetical protein
MSTEIEKPRKPRKDAFYTREEIQVINIHKEEYKIQTTRELRGHIFKAKILVDLFNFWVDQGNAPEDEEESTNRIKVGKIIITVTLQF